MRKAGIITLAVIGTALFMSCANSKSVNNGYFGVSNAKLVKKQQKEFKRPKHKLDKCKANGGH